jgi:aromatic ring-opening dioxygenase catalytic subunit (LigB family)
MVSLQRDLDPAQHIAFGRALAPLRDEGVVVAGSGMSYHDLRHFRDGDGRDSEIFDAWLGEAATAAPEARRRALTQWAEAPAGRACHPREEHLLPLMVVAGAASDSAGVRDFHDVIGGKTISAFRFG